MHVVISPPGRRVCFGSLRGAGTCDVKAQQCEYTKTEHRRPNSVLFPIAEVFAHDIGIMPRRDCGSDRHLAERVGVEIDNGSVTHESEAKAFSPESICIVLGNAGWD